MKKKLIEFEYIKRIHLNNGRQAKFYEGYIMIQDGKVLWWKYEWIIKFMKFEIKEYFVAESRRGGRTRIP